MQLFLGLLRMNKRRVGDVDVEGAVLVKVFFLCCEPIFWCVLN